MKNSKRVDEIISWYDHENEGTKENIERFSPIDVS